MWSVRDEVLLVIRLRIFEAIVIQKFAALGVLSSVELEIEVYGRILN